MIQTTGDRKRLLDVKKILKKYKEQDISQDTLDEINDKFPEINACSYITVDEIYESLLIRTVSLDLKKMSIIGLITTITTNKKKQLIYTLFNKFTNTIWKINPKKYYLFVVERSNNDMNMLNYINNIIT